MIFALQNAHTGNLVALPPPQPDPVFVHRPGLVVNSSGRVPLDVASAYHPPVAPPFSRSDLAPFDAKCATAACQLGPLRDWHIHQLFRQLQAPKRRALRDLVQSDHGHIDHLLDRRRQDHHQLVYQLRHRNVVIEHRDRNEGLDHLLHGVPLDPCLRPRWLTQTGWSPPPRRRHFLAGAQFKVLGACVPCCLEKRSGPERGREAQLLLPFLAIVWPRGPEWCANSARAMATLKRSWRPPQSGPPQRELT